MRIAVISCDKYRDAWRPFFALFARFWTHCEHERFLLTDRLRDGCDLGVNWSYFERADHWGEILREFSGVFDDDSILLLQEDFFLNAPVDESRIAQALDILARRGVGMVRLYPCPGMEGRDAFNRVPRGAAYRISCQASIWKPHFLHRIALAIRHPWEFEIEGTRLAESLPEEVYAFNRELSAWPIQYLCSAISRGKWTQGARELCAREAIDVDWTKRELECV